MSTARQLGAAAGSDTSPATPQSAVSPGSADDGQLSSKSKKSSKQGTTRRLTESQLEKKRANDREAQRAIRERTRKQIEALEQRIRDLESGVAIQELKNALKQKDAVEEENTILRHKLKALWQLLEPTVQNFGIDDLRPSTSISHSPASTKREYVDEYDQFKVNRKRDDHASPASILHESDAVFPQRPIFARVPPNIPPTCRLDTIIQDFTSGCQRQLERGVPLFDVIGPSYPVFDSMVHFHPDLVTLPRNMAEPQTREPLPRYPLSELLVDVLRGFSAIHDLASQVATISAMFCYMRWVIAPSAETYNEIPPWLAPSEAQLHIAHPTWIDYIPWPQMRDKMLHSFHVVGLDQFFLPYTTNLYFDFRPSTLNGNAGHARNAPRSHSQAGSPVGYRLELARLHQTVLYRDAAGHLRSQPALDVAWRDMRNWQLDPAFAIALPCLEGTFCPRQN